MRLKQVLGVLVALLLCSAMAVAAASQLTDISVSSEGNTATLTVRATGTFSHNEYRPEDSVLLVDLTGVSAANLQEKQKTLDLPSVKSYRVLSYKGANGIEVTRLEVALGERVAMAVKESRGGLQVTLRTGAEVKSASAAAAKPAPKPVEKAAEKPAVEAPAAAAIRHVSVQRKDGSVAIEIVGASTAQATTLTGPDRLVLDFPGTVPAMRSRINVNSPEIKTIRVARFQSQPPVTRVVVDLTAPREYQIAPAGNKLVVRMPAEAPAPVAQVAAAPAKALKTAPVQTAKAAEPAPSAPKRIDSPKPAEPTLAAAPKPEQPRAEEQVAAIPAPKQEQLKAEPVLAASAVPTSVPVPKDPPQSKLVVPAPAAKSAQDYTFVEPAWKQEAPAERASNAAVTMARANPQTETPSIGEAGTLSKPGPALSLATLQEQQASGAAQPKPRYTGEPISVNLKDVDLRDFFRLVHEISGLNIVLDPNVRGTVTLVLDDVPWDQALDIVLQNNALDRQLHGNVLRIASQETVRKEAEGRRAQIEAQALAVDKQTVTRFLSYAHAKDAAPTVKRFLTTRGEVMFDERTNALIISDIPSVIPDIDRLLVQLDRKTQEVEIEARVVAANRNFARDLGMQLGFGWGNGSTSVGGASAVGKTPTEVGYFFPPAYTTVPGVKPPTGTGAPQSTAAAIPLFTNHAAQDPTTGLSFLNLGAAYRLDAVLTMAESRGLVKILSRPRVVTQNNVSATVRQGLRIPIVTAAQLGGPPTTTYIDAFLRLTVTPQITVENTIFLAVDVENTTPDFSRTVNGNPTLLTQQATTQVLVTDGGTVVIGGVIQTQNAITTQQTPLLGDIPVLGNLFKRRKVSTESQELIFFINPRIIQT